MPAIHENGHHANRQSVTNLAGTGCGSWQRATLTKIQHDTGSGIDWRLDRTTAALHAVQQLVCGLQLKQDASVKGSCAGHLGCAKSESESGRRKSATDIVKASCQPVLSVYALV